ncbi:MAG: hypothetical protein ACRD36_10680, partial [Candidatus Acidiferrum sp.]
LWYRVALLPEEKLKPLFDDFQWNNLAQQLNQIKKLRQQWKQGGIWPDDEDDNKNAEKGDK